MIEKLLNASERQEQNTGVYSNEVFKTVSAHLSVRFDTDGVELWWNSVHFEIQTTPLELLKLDPVAFNVYCKKYGIE
jgi:hypothetical protein